MAYFYVFIGGGLGAVCRYGVTTTVGMLLGGMFPWGTLVVNLVGSLLMGLVLGALLPLAKSLQLLPESLNYNRKYLKGAEGTVSAVNRGTDLILRAGPGTGYDALGLLFGGEVLGYLGDAKRDGSGTCWYHCSHYGEECWISAKFTALTLNDGTTYTGSRGVF